jgi:hypothetical protein
MQHHKIPNKIRNFENSFFKAVPLRGGALKYFIKIYYIKVVLLRGIILR